MLKITPKPHQVQFSALCWELLVETGYVYLAGKPRSGKTLTAILTAETSQAISRVLVLTTKAAIGYPKRRDAEGNIEKDKDGKPIFVTNKNSKHYISDHEEGWLKFTNHMDLNHSYHVTNYEQAGSIKGNKIVLKLNSDDYDLVIIDESHNLGVVGKSTTRYKVIKKLCWDMPHIHLSGTAVVESPNGIYHQMAISKYTPFNHKNFYDFFKLYGEPYYIPIGGRDITQYDRCKDTLMPEVDKFTVYMTQEDASISSLHQATDELHYVELNDDTRSLYNKLQTEQVITLPNGNVLMCDSDMKLRTSLHMMESGVAKIDEDYIFLGNTEKIDYIRDTFGDSADVGIMCHFIGERKLLRQELKNVQLYSSKGDAEGTDMSHLKHYIILSADYSGAKFIQRRDRVVNMEGSNTTKVHFILVKQAISEQAYKKCSKKEDFNNATYRRQEI